MTRRRDDRGQAGVQFAGMFPVLLIIVLVCVKIYFAMTAVELVDNAARTGAREASKHHDPALCQTEALAALPDSLKDTKDDGVGATATGAGDPVGAISCHVRAKLPVLWKAVPFDFTVDRTVYMPG